MYLFLKKWGYLSFARLVWFNFTALLLWEHGVTERARRPFLSLAFAFVFAHLQVCSRSAPQVKLFQEELYEAGGRIAYVASR